MAKLDTALVAAALKEDGYNLTDHVKEADVVLINTCSVREHAEQRVLSHIGHLKHIKQQKPNLGSSNNKLRIRLAVVRKIKLHLQTWIVNVNETAITLMITVMMSLLLSTKCISDCR